MVLLLLNWIIFISSRFRILQIDRLILIYFYLFIKICLFAFHLFCFSFFRSIGCYASSHDERRFPVATAEINRVISSNNNYYYSFFTRRLMTLNWTNLISAREKGAKFQIFNGRFYYLFSFSSSSLFVPLAKYH